MFFLLSMFSRCRCSIPLLRLLSKMLLWNNFCQRAAVEQLLVAQVALDVLLPGVLFDVEHPIVVERSDLHSLDIGSCCARCCCRSSFHILLSNVLSRSSSLMMLALPMFCWMSSTFSKMNS